MGVCRVPGYLSILIEIETSSSSVQDNYRLPHIELGLNVARNDNFHDLGKLGVLKSEKCSLEIMCSLSYTTQKCTTLFLFETDWTDMDHSSSFVDVPFKAHLMLLPAYVISPWSSTRISDPLMSQGLLQSFQDGDIVPKRLLWKCGGLLEFLRNPTKSTLKKRHEDLAILEEYGYFEDGCELEKVSRHSKTPPSIQDDISCKDFILDKSINSMLVSMDDSFQVDRITSLYLSFFPDNSNGIVLSISDALSGALRSVIGREPYYDYIIVKNIQNMFPGGRNMMQSMDTDISLDLLSAQDLILSFLRKTKRSSKFIAFTSSVHSMNPDVAELFEIVMTMKDFKLSIKNPRKNCAPNFEQCIGMETEKAILTQTVIWPLVHADIFQSVGVKALRGVLLYGTPGTGKTMLAKHITTESDCSFFNISVHDLIHSEIGASEGKLKSLFASAKKLSPCIVFFDEMQAIFPKMHKQSSSHDRSMQAQLIHEMQALKPTEKVIVIGATNDPYGIDPVILSYGLFEKFVRIGLPDEPSRVQMIKAYCEIESPATETDRFIEWIAAQCEGYTGADIRILCRLAHSFCRTDEIQRYPVSTTSILNPKYWMEALKHCAGSTIEDIQRIDDFEPLPLLNKHVIEIG